MITETVVVALIAAVGVVVSSIVGSAAVLWKQTHETQKSVNGRMEELLDVTRRLARAQGIETGQQQEREREAKADEGPNSAD